MKRVVKLLLLTVMLKVWWHDKDRYGKDFEHESIVLSATPYASCGGEAIFVVDVTNDRGFHWITKDLITKKAFIEQNEQML